MRKPVSDILREIVSGLLILDDTPSEEDLKKKREYKIPQNVCPEGEQAKVSVVPLKRRNVPNIAERDIIETKRPDIRRPRRESDIKSEWKGDGDKVKDKRNEYQKQYRAENGNK